MKRNIPLDELPERIQHEDAVAAACRREIEEMQECARQGRSLLITCDKELNLFLVIALREKLRASAGSQTLRLVDGRMGQPLAEGELEATTAPGRMLQQLRAALRSNVKDVVICLPHLDLLMSNENGLSLEARDALPLLFENPDATFLGFGDPSFRMPKVLDGVFAATCDIVGIPRDALPHLVTEREARAMHGDFLNPYGLYKYLSGQNPIRARRALSPFAELRECAPGEDRQHAAYQRLRKVTSQSDAHVPNVDMGKDIGGYENIKTRLHNELIVLAERLEAAEPGEVSMIESLLPRGMLFHGPAGTGKTFFAKALATSLNATVFIVSGPELKSKWVGESEHNLRQLFRQARQSAPSVIIFDEIDAFAMSRDRQTSSGAEHSMINQLLTEMDGFRDNEMVFTVATTNFLESVDPALLRPGRFEFLIHVPAPDADDRHAILKILNEKMQTRLTDEQCEYWVRQTEGYAIGRSPFTGDHLKAQLRSLKRLSLRTGQEHFTNEDIDAALKQKTRRRINLSDEEERVIAVHESGHALLAMVIPHARPPERVALSQDEEGALGFVMQAASTRPYAMNERDLRAEICVGLGGIVAEKKVFGTASVGAFSDLQNVNRLAAAMVLEYGMSEDVGLRVAQRERRFSDAFQARIDEAIDSILAEERARAEAALQRYASEHEAMTSLLLEHKRLDAGLLGTLFSPASPVNEGAT